MPQSQAPPPPPRSAPNGGSSSSERKQQLDAWRRQRQEQQQQQQQRKPPPFRPVSVRPRATSISSVASSSLQPPTSRRRATMAVAPSVSSTSKPSAASSSSSTTGSASDAPRSRRSSPGGSHSPLSSASLPPELGAPAGDTQQQSESFSLPQTHDTEDVAVLTNLVAGEAHALEALVQSQVEREEIVVATQSALLEDEIVTKSVKESDPRALSPRWRRQEDARDDHDSAAALDDAVRTLERNLIREFDAERGEGGDDAVRAVTDPVASGVVLATQIQEQRYADQVDDSEQVLAMLLEQVESSRAVRESDAPDELDEWLRDDQALQREEEMARGETEVVEAPIAFSAAAMVTATTVMEANEEIALTSSAAKCLASDSRDQTSDEEQSFEDEAAHANVPSLPGTPQQSDEHAVLEAEREVSRRSTQDHSRRLTKTIVAGVTGLVAFALLMCTAVCWFSPPGAQTLTQRTAASCLAIPSAIKRAYNKGGAWWTSVWGRSNASHPEAGWKSGLIELAASSLSKAKTFCSNSSEALQRHSSYYLTSVLNGLKSAASGSVHALGSVWESVFPSSRDADLIEATRAQLLDPFEADQRALNEKLKVLMLKQEAWALEELKRMKKRRALHASTTESILTSTRTLVLDALHEAKVIAEHHVESYTETISDQLLQSIQRELEEHEQRMNEELRQTARTAVKQETESLENTARYELDALEKQKVEEEQVLDLELSVGMDQVATAKETLVRELAAMAEREKTRIEAEYTRVSAEVASKLEQVERDLFDVSFENTESQVAGMASQAKTELEEEDAMLLEELKKLEELAATRVIVEQERALADVAEAAKQREEQVRHERELAEELARALGEEEERVAAERRSAEEEIAETARRDILRLEEERKKAEAELLVAHQQEQERIQQEELKAEAELAKIKQEEEELAQRERAKAEAAIAEAARVEELRVQHEQELIQARVAQEAAAEEKRLRAERAVAEEALERALEEERTELFAQLEEGEQIVQQVAGVEVTAPEAVVPAAVEHLPSDQDASVGAEVASIATMFPSMPKVELYNLGLVSVMLFVLALVTAWVLSRHYRRLEARTRQRARAALKARRKRWQRVPASSDSDSAEEVVLLASSSAGNEPEPEVLGSPEMAAPSVSEDLSQTSSAEELDETSMIRQADAQPDAVEVREEAIVAPPADPTDDSDANADGESEEESRGAAARRPNALPHSVVRRRTLRVTRTTTTTATRAGETE